MQVQFELAFERAQDLFDRKLGRTKVKGMVLKQHRSRSDSKLTAMQDRQRISTLLKDEIHDKVMQEEKEKRKIDEISDDESNNTEEVLTQFKQLKR